MPQVPYTGAPQVAPQYPATPAVRPQVSPGAFGAGVAEAQAGFGRELRQAGDELFGRALALQQLDQQASALNAHADASDKISDRLVQFRTLSGKAAFDDYKPFQADVNKIIEEGSAGLTSDYAKKLYLQESRALRSRTIGSAAAHAGTEFKNYQIGTQKSVIDNARNQALLHPEDEGAYLEAIKVTRHSSEFLGDLSGFGPEQKTDLFNSEMSKTSTGRAKALADNGDIAGAQRALETAQEAGLISGADAGNATKFIRGQRNQITSRIEAPKILDGVGGHFGTGKVSIDRLYKAVVGVESEQDYSVTNTFVHKGGPLAGKKDTALGVGQVLQSNLASWLSEAGMPNMSPREYLNNHEAQDKLIKFKLNQYQEKYGNANEVAKTWRGRGGYTDAKTGETEEQYLTKFNAKLAQTAGFSDLESAVTARASEIIPDDDEFASHLLDRTTTLAARQRADEREEFRSQRAIVDEAMLKDIDGKLPTSPEDLGPEAKQIWDQNPKIRKVYEKQFERNVKAGYALTPQNQAEFLSWQEKMKSEYATPEERASALDEDFVSKAWPLELRQKAFDAQQKLRRGFQANPPVEYAMKVIREQLNQAGIKSGDSDYTTISAEMRNILEELIARDGKVPKEPELRQIGADLLQREATKPGFWAGDKWPNTVKLYTAGVPDKHRAVFIQTYKDRNDGRAPTEDELNQIWVATVYTELYSKKSKPKNTAKAP